MITDVNGIIQKQKSFFDTGRTRDVDFRITQLKKLKSVMMEYQDEIYDALKKDLNKAKFEAYETEVGVVLAEINYALRHIKSWAKDKTAYTPLFHFISTSRISPEPFGVTLIMSAWNYPFQLTVAPLIGALAAGNCAVLKPSQYSPNTADVIEKIVRIAFREDYVAVIKGGREVNRDLFAEKFDYVFFTGSVAVGKVVMEAASRNLTPVTLELGGKSPCVVDKTANIKLAAKRIVWGKLMNAGQTCIAPDYVYVDKQVKAELIDNMKKYIVKMYGEDPVKCKELPRIVNEKHFDRISELMKSGNIIAGGQKDRASLKIAPTLLDNVTWDDPVMGEEIFGPLLPIIEYEKTEDVYAELKNHPKPLAFYFFSTDKKRQEEAVRNVSFGGGCINDTVIHITNPKLMFGGVGQSGMGSYHGEYGFKTFSNMRGIMKKSNILDIPARYPPFRDKLWILRIFIR